MLPNQTHPNWVTERAQCNLDFIFEALCQIIERDVTELNGLSEEQRKGRTFSLEVISDGKSPIANVTENANSNDDRKKAWARFEKSTVAIRIQVFIPRVTGDTAFARPEWNERALSCRLTMNGQQYKVWEISQIVLGPIFFNDYPNRRS